MGLARVSTMGLARVIPRVWQVCRRCPFKRIVRSMTRATNRDKNRSVMFTFHEFYEHIFVHYVTPRLVFLSEWVVAVEIL